jgi:S-disulfanyl-L-cysteine oxidoreductase SoxD
MKTKLAVLALAGLASLGLYQTNLRAQDGGKAASDGVYSKAQSDAGKGGYASKCASCHGDALTGGEMAPPLAGGDFMANWNGLTVFDFFDRVRKTMPLGKEGSMSREETAQITAFILQSNGYPAGAALATQDELLKMIKLDTKR